MISWQEFISVLLSKHKQSPLSGALIFTGY
ncbi:Uncharacterised protein [Achromobacter xylosoxidans]|nr:Uncharacterised protein [Achromobacter xylosoxidans]